jgi:hypothetical protein
MSVISEIRKKIELLGYSTTKTTWQKWVNVKPQHNPIVAILETSSELEPADDDGRLYEIKVVLSISIYCRDSSDEVAYDKAETIRDQILELLSSNMFYDLKVFIDSWEQIFEDESGIGAFNIQCYYNLFR